SAGCRAATPGPAGPSGRRRLSRRRRARSASRRSCRTRRARSAAPTTAARSSRSDNGPSVTPPTTGRGAPVSWRLPGAPASVDADREYPVGVPVEPGTVRIAVDLLGGDDAPAVVVDGALRALRADPDLHLLLV